MGLSMRDIDIPNKYPDRKVRARIVEGEDYATFYIEDIGWHPQASREQYAHIPKEELLDVLAQMGWLPDEYRKAEPLDPREAKIREVALLIHNDDASRDSGYMTTFDTYEELVEDVGEVGVVADYRANAEALIAAGLVKVVEE